MHLLLARPARLAAVTAGLAVVAVLAAGCGSDDAEAATTDQAAVGADQQGAGDQQGADGRLPGAFGRIAAVSGDVLQVQNDQSGQVAVTVADGTAVTDQVEAAQGDVEVGACVTVRADDSADGTDGTDGTVAAATVSITQPADDGSCGAGTAGMGGGPGGPGGDGQRPTDLPEGMPTDRPSDLPDGMPTDLPGGQPGGFGTAGQVSAVTAGGFTVESTFPGADASSVEVTVDADTTYTLQASATAKALKVGRCVVATGEADDTGAVAADRISVSDPVDGACTTGFGGRGRPDGATQ
ncbi:DUF5666 domain-containing protein [Nocardioides sp. YIM 152588]|uniref:DUF5666 domain-containing protein n=1 Tax=Nocardioides sp. YIM 152588 TaxID=3158259 RepID=UPI0032E4073C